MAPLGLSGRTSPFDAVETGQSLSQHAPMQNKDKIGLAINSAHWLHRRGSGSTTAGLTVGLAFLVVLLGTVGYILSRAKSRRPLRKPGHRHKHWYGCEKPPGEHVHHSHGNRHHHHHKHRSHRREGMASGMEDWVLQHPELAYEMPDVWGNRRAVDSGTDMDAPQIDTVDEADARWDWMAWRMAPSLARRAKKRGTTSGRHGHGQRRRHH